jgi:type II secretory pathway pseudopilin PulG
MWKLSHPGSAVPFISAHKACKRATKRRGSTLTELLIWVGVAAFLFALTIPKFGVVRSSLQVDRAAQQLAGAVMLARTEAMATRSLRSIERQGTTAYRNAANRLVSLPGGVTFASGSASTVSFGAFGPPAAAAEFTLQVGGRSKRVVVNQGGLVSVR